MKPLLGSLFLQALLYVSARKLSPVDMIAQHILASLLANATATTRSGFLARIATIHSAREPLYLWAADSDEAARLKRDDCAQGFLDDAAPL